MNLDIKILSRKVTKIKQTNYFSKNKNNKMINQSNSKIKTIKRLL